MNLRYFAEQILALYEENDYLRAEVERLKVFEKKYDDLVMEDIRHGEKMMGGWLALIMDGHLKVNKETADNG